MATISRTTMRGQRTLLASWAALARTSPGARLVHSQSAVAAVFPAWAPLNNAILLDRPSSLTAAAAAVELGHLYDSAGVATWAMWLPSPAGDRTAPDEVPAVGGMTRDATTVVMELTLTTSSPGRLAEGVVRTSVDAAGRAGEEPVAADELPPPHVDDGLEAWVIVRDGVAVAGAWSLIEGSDCGIYTVSTVPAWRRQGLARALTLGVLADARRRGATTATLQSTAMGEPLYASVGFEPVGRYDEWVPA